MSKPPLKLNELIAKLQEIQQRIEYDSEVFLAEVFFDHAFDMYAVLGVALVEDDVVITGRRAGKF
jgi:hypothetical protein